MTPGPKRTTTPSFTNGFSHTKLNDAQADTRHYITLKALFIIEGVATSDRRAREALRIAAGIGVWGKVRPTICFARSSDPALGQAYDEELRRYILLLRETTGDLFTLAPAEPTGLLRHTDEAGLAKLIDDADTVLRF
ncbi:MAG: hypothetical protein VX392_05430 [Verrucomicrobiota bacterium]|nr:hypothetical protein [Verrucomicrobiota bacterium]